MILKNAKTTMDAALLHLVRLVSEGKEYPDAHARVCWEYGLGSGYYAELLQARYDAHCKEG